MRDRLLYPNLQQGIVGAWCPSLGATGNILLGRSPYCINGTLTNMDPGTDWVVNGDGLSLDFDGINNYVDVGTRVGLPGALTISAWINTRVVDSTIRYICGNYNGDTATDYLFEINRVAGKMTAWRNIGGVAVTSNTALSAGVWYHVALTMAGSSSDWTVAVYLDGKVDGSATTAENPTGNNTFTSIGRPGMLAGYDFNGYIDDVRLYNRALRPSEVLQLASRRRAAYQTTRRHTVRRATAAAGTNKANMLVGAWI